MRRLVSLCTVMTLTFPLAAAAEEGSFHLVVRSECPSEATMREALRRQVTLDRLDRQLTISVESRPEGHQLTVQLEDSELLTRVITDADCAAVAEAFALITLTHLTSLHMDVAMVEADHTALSMVSAVAPQTSESALPVQDEATSEESEVASSAESAVAGRTETEPFPAPDVDVGRGIRLGFAALGGLEVSFEPSLLAGMGQGDISVQPLRFPFVFRLGGTIASWTTQQSRLDRVERRHGVIRLDLSYRWDRWPVYLQPTVMIGLDISKVIALDLEGSEPVIRAHAAIGAAFSLGVRITSSLSVRIDLALNLYPSNDDYEISPIGVVASSPRATLMTALGFQYDLVL